MSKNRESLSVQDLKKKVADLQKVIDKLLEDFGLETDVRVDRIGLTKSLFPTTTIYLDTNY